MPPDAAWVWSAFEDLHESRQSGFDVNPLPCVEIESWLNLNSVRSPDLRRFCYRVVHLIDCEWVAWARTKKDAS